MAEGHRQRIREKIENSGISSLHDHELLEYILFPFIPRKDVSTLARNLLYDYGDLQGVFTASSLELRRYKNMTDNAAQFLPLVPEVYSRACASKVLFGGSMVSPRVVARYLYYMFAHLKYERFVIIAIDSKTRFIKARSIDGLTNVAKFDINEVVEFAMSTKARYVIIGHNHVMTDEIPSNDDLEANRQIYQSLAGVKSLLIDHIVVSGKKYFSFFERRLNLNDLTPLKLKAYLDQEYKPKNVEDDGSYDEEECGGYQ